MLNLITQNKKKGADKPLIYNIVLKIDLIQTISK